MSTKIPPTKKMKRSNSLRRHLKHKAEKKETKPVATVSVESNQSSEEFDFNSDPGEDESYVELDEPLLNNEVESIAGFGDGTTYDWKVLHPEEIIDYMKTIIEEINQIVQLSPTVMRLLLNYFKWDKERLMEAYYEKSQKQLFKEAKIFMPTKKKLLAKKWYTSNENILVECGICCIDVAQNLMFGLSCEHRFCMKCWTYYIKYQIMEKGNGESIVCAGDKCQLVLEDTVVERLIDDSNVRRRYQRLLTNNFVECNSLVKWCPEPSCQNAIKVDFVDSCSVSCSCGSSFCYKCSSPWHAPILCDMLKKWLQKLADDSETTNWIKANTKYCPKCQSPIEKDGGCNHMLCGNKSCNFEFCWICMHGWSVHGYVVNCNKFIEKDIQNQSVARISLQRYLHYYNLYMNHQESLKLEKNLYDCANQKMDEFMQDNNLSWIEVQFLHKAVDTLRKCRQTLMYTYVFAFYIEKDNQRNIFEANQSDLQSAVEELSGYLEKDSSTAELGVLKAKVIDKSKYCESRRRVLLNHVNEGYDKDLWKHRSDI